MVNRDLGHMRQNYLSCSLSEKDLHADPIEQFKLWLDQALAANILEPNAMSLATSNLQGKPSCRIVLLKKIDQGLVFFTNYSSRKGCEIAINNQVAATFWWPSMERQVRVEGSASQVESDFSDKYFQSRPLGSQISASISPQSQVIDTYQQLINQVDAMQETQISPLIRPRFWGGYRINIQSMEFWQGRSNRLHDRFNYRLSSDSTHWVIERLAP